MVRKVLLALFLLALCGEAYAQIVGGGGACQATNNNGFGYFAFGVGSF